MRIAALAIAMVGCGAAQHPSASRRVALAYDVALDPSLASMTVTLCPADGPLPDAVVPVHDEVQRHLRAAAIVDGETVVRTIAPSARLDLSDAPPSACLRYELDLSTCLAPHGPTGCVRVGDDLFAPTSNWLLAPATRSRAAHYDLHFALPPGVVPTPIAEAHAIDATHVVLDDRNIEFVTYVAFVHAPAEHVALPGACADVVTLDGSLDATGEMRAHWLSAATEASARVTGEPPFARISALVVPSFDAPGMPVLFGVAGRGMRPTVTLLVSEHATEDALVHDWTLVHELSHFLTAYVDGEDTWLSEGLATYYQEVLRARQGLVTEEAAWRELALGFERGRTDLTGSLRSACGSMHVSHAYMRVYWHGAALVLLADLAYRRAGSSLDEAIARAWPHRMERTTATQLLAWLDGIENGTFAQLAERSLDAEAFPDVETALTWLGVQVDAGGGVTLDANAPGAAVRSALMNGTAPRASNPASCAAE